MSDLYRLPWAEAKRRKWEAGRAKYGDTWAGEHPLIEAYSEVVDLSNYLDEADQREDSSPYYRAQAQRVTRELAGYLKRMIEQMEEPNDGK